MSTLREKVEDALQRFPYHIEHCPQLIEHLAEALKTAALIERAENMIVGWHREGLLLEVRANGPGGIVQTVLSRASDGSAVGGEMVHMNTRPDGHVRWVSSPEEPIILRATDPGSKRIAVDLEIAVHPRVLA